MESSDQYGEESAAQRLLPDLRTPPAAAAASHAPMTAASEAPADELDICASPLDAGELYAHLLQSNQKASAEAPAQPSADRSPAQSPAKPALDCKPSLAADDFVDFGDDDEADASGTVSDARQESLHPSSADFSRPTTSPNKQPQKHNSRAKDIDLDREGRDSRRTEAARDSSGHPKSDPRDDEVRHKSKDGDHSRSRRSPVRYYQDHREKDSRRHERQADSPGRPARRHVDDRDRKRDRVRDDRDRGGRDSERFRDDRGSERRKDSERFRDDRDAERSRDQHRDYWARDREHERSYERDRNRDKQEERRESRYQRREELPKGRASLDRKSKDYHYRSPARESRPREYDRPAAPVDQGRSFSPSYSQARPSGRAAYRRDLEPEVEVSDSSRKREPLSFSRQARDKQSDALPDGQLQRRSTSHVAEPDGGLSWAALDKEPEERQSMQPRVPLSPSPRPTAEAARQIADSRATLKELFKKSARLCDRDGMDRNDPEYAAISLGSVKVYMNRRFGYVVDFSVVNVKSWSELVDREAKDMCFKPFADGPDSKADRIVNPTPEFRRLIIREIEEEAAAAAEAAHRRPLAAPEYAPFPNPYTPGPVQQPVHRPRHDVHQGRVQQGRQYSDPSQPSPYQPDDHVYSQRRPPADREYSGQLPQHPQQQIEQIHSGPGRRAARHPQYQDEYEPAASPQQLRQLQQALHPVYSDDYAPARLYEHSSQPASRQLVDRSEMQPPASAHNGRYMASYQVEEEPAPIISSHPRAMDERPEELHRNNPEPHESSTSRRVAIPPGPNSRGLQHRESKPELDVKVVTSLVRSVLKEKLEARARQGQNYRFTTFRKDFREVHGIDLDRPTVESLGYSSLSNFVEGVTKDMCEFLWQNGGHVDVKALEPHQDASHPGKRKRKTTAEQTIDDMRDFLADTMKSERRMFLAQLRPEFEKTFRYTLDVYEVGYSKLYQMISDVASDIVEMVTPPGNPAGTELFPVKSQASRR